MERAKLANAVSAAGPSLLERLWEELDAVMDRLYADGEAPIVARTKLLGCVPDSREMAAFREEVKLWGEQRGQAQGLAYAIAVITNPYDVNVPKIKKIAAKRLRNRLEDDE